MVDGIRLATGSVICVAYFVHGRLGQCTVGIADGGIGRGGNGNYDRDSAYAFLDPTAPSDRDGWGVGIIGGAPAGLNGSVDGDRWGN